jgi:nitronate monooxygenase
VVLSERITGVPLAVLDTPAVRRMGLRSNPLERWLLKHPRTKHAFRTWFVLRSAFSLKDGARRETSQFWQAGKSVAAIERIEPTGDIVRAWAEAARGAEGASAVPPLTAPVMNVLLGSARTHRTARSRQNPMRA